MMQELLRQQHSTCHYPPTEKKEKAEKYVLISHYQHTKRKSTSKWGENLNISDF